MGRLRQLELENFKSYAGKQVVGPFDDFTCVIGPNGSGKSNMMDAVSFVLGVQTQHLRSSSLKELLYRRDADSVPARTASVKLTYELSAGELPGRKDGSTMVFGRTINAANESTFLINNKEVSYEAYEDCLKQIGVLVKARNFLVFQGDIESLASKSPLEVTRLLEQICGSDEMRVEYERLLQEKDHAEETALFSLHKRKMYATQKKEIKDQKDEADSFQQRREELGSLKTEQLLMKIWTAKEGLDSHSDEVELLKAQIGVMNSKEKKQNEELAGGKKSLARVSKALVTQEKDRAVKSKLVGSLAAQLDETRARIKGLRKRVDELTKATAAVQSDRKAQEDSIVGLQRDMKRLEEAEKEIERALKEAESRGFNLDEEKVAEYARLREEVSAQTAADIAQDQLLEQEIRSKHLQVERLVLQLKSTRNEEDSGAVLVQEYRTRIEKLRGAITAGVKDAEDLKKQRDANLVTIATCQQRAVELTAQLEAVVEKLRNIGEDRFRSKQEDKIATAIDAMQKIFSGVYGKLGDLCKPIQKKYAQAIQVAAGKQMDAVVVESKAVAQECIRYLKDQRAGVCQFLPLNNMDSKPVSDRLRSFAPKYKLCADLVECDEKFKPALAYALGATLVCDTLDEAQELCFTRGEKVKVVTAAGHVISKNGAMTGGSSAKDGQDRWEEKEVERLRTRKFEVEEALADNKHSTPGRQQQVDLEMRLKTLQTRIQFSEADCKVTEEKLKQLNQQGALKRAFAVQTEKNAEQARAEVLQLEMRQIEIQKRISRIETSVFSAFSASVGVANVREYERKALRTHDDLVKRRTAAAEEKASLAAQLQYESTRDFKGIEARLIEQTEAARRAIVTQDEVETRLMTSEEEERRALSKINASVDSLRKQRADVVGVVKALQLVMATLLEERDVLASKLAGEEILLDRMKTKLHDILQRAQVDEIALPTLEMGEEESQASELKWSGSQSQSQTQRTKAKKGGDSESQSAADRKKAAKVDISSMEKLRELSKQQVQEQDEELLAKIEAITAELDVIQPNMHAGERYDGVVGKLQECEDELDDVRNNARDLSLRFEELKKRRQKLFQECYQHISETLSVIYRDLTRSSKHPAGGTAYLTLDNTDEPYLGGTRFTAMPPMKRFRDMEQLSGGEKTMAALALLFSIHSFRQAPFFVLDEVDAALDNVNVKKICNYIQQRSRDFQCIVISLKDMFFEHADSLVGVTKDVDQLSSKIYTLDLKAFDDLTLKDKTEGSQVYASPPSAKADRGRTPQSGSTVTASGGTLKRKQSPGSAAKKKRTAKQNTITEDFED